MRIQIVIDNRNGIDTLEKEHGLCVYVETDTYKCLLDTGASGKFLRNAAKLDIDIAAIDYVFISHGHSDHIGGLLDFVSVNSKAKIVLSRNALTQQFYSNRNGFKKISSDINLRDLESRCVFVGSETVFRNEIHVFPCCVRNNPMPMANKTLFKELENVIVPDDFNHELIVCFDSAETVVYSGCAHGGILNTLACVKQTIAKPVGMLIGGFHLLDDAEGNYETEDEITKIADQLALNYPETEFYTGHCTGEQTYKLLQTKLKDRIKQFHTGFSISIPTN